MPYFDGAEVRLYEAPAGEKAQEALDAFLRLDARDRLADSRHVHAYMVDVLRMCGSEEDEASMEAALRHPQEVWRHLRPKGLLVALDGDRSYVALDADCDWEIEHGLAMVWLGGRRLVMVGEYDGGLTNGEALSDPDVGRVIYRSLWDDGASTFRDAA